MPAFTDDVRSWAEQADTNTETVEVWIHARNHGGMPGAKAWARKIAMAFNSLRNYERRRVNRRVQAEGVPLQYKMDTPYQDVICFTSVQETLGAVLVEFFHKDSPRWTDMFEVRGMPKFDASQALPELEELQRPDAEVAGVFKPAHDWVGDLPDDADPFA